MVFQPEPEHMKIFHLDRCVKNRFGDQPRLRNGTKFERLSENVSISKFHTFVCSREDDIVTEKEWTYLAKVLDRLCLMCFGTACLVIPGSLLTVGYINYTRELGAKFRR